MGDILKMPDGSHLVAGMIGPICGDNDVIIEGRKVPNMTMRVTETEVLLILDRRIAFPFPKALAYHAASFAANAMAIGAGYPCFTAEKKVEHFAVPCIGLGNIPES